MNSDGYPGTTQPLPPAYIYRVTRYDPADRNEHGYYTGAEDTRSDRGPVEAAYWEAVAAFAHDTGITQLTIREPALGRPTPPLGTRPQDPDPATLFESGLAGYHDGAQVSVPVALELVRGMLRDGGAWCRLEADGEFSVHVGWDQYVYIGSSKPCDLARSRTRQLDLFAEPLAASPYAVSFDEPGEQRPADDDFWSSVHLATPRGGAVLLEEGYVHNDSRWHRLPASLAQVDREALRSRLAPRALLTVWPDVLSPDIVAVLRALPGGPGAEYSVTVLREDRAGGITGRLFDEDHEADLRGHLADARAAAILPAQPEVVNELDDSQDTSGRRPLFTAVLPDPDGVLRARWRTQPTPADLRWDRLHRIRRGEIRTGTVTSIESFGVLVDIGDHTTGSINAAELSWQRYDHYTDVVQVGQEVTVQVLDVDLQRERISLSRKAMQPDPLSQVTNAPGDLVPGRVTKLLPFGAFVLLGGTFTGAVEGLVHVSELSPAPDGHPADVLQVGDEVTVRILSVDRERRRVSLALGPAFREHQHPAEQDCGAGSRKSA